MISLVKYSKVDFSKIKLEIPKKINGVYTSEVDYNELQFMIQTPVLYFNIKENSEHIIAKSNCKEFISFFDSLSIILVKLLHVNSKEFFNGKDFSMERLSASLQEFVELENIDEFIQNGERDSQEINNITLSKDIKITNVFNEVILPIYPIKGKCVLHIKNITFHGKQFKLNIEAKMIKTEYKKKVNPSLLLDLESESEEEIMEEEKVKTEKLENIESENLESEENKVKIDSLDFFD